MNAVTIPMPDLIRLLAAKVDCGEDAAGQFLREFAVVVGQGLATDGLVRIAGLGTFKVVTDVNGKLTVDFAPEPSMAETVNEPFAMFESVEVAESVTDEELEGNINETVVTPAEPTVTEPAVTEPVAAEPVVIEPVVTEPVEAEPVENSPAEAVAPTVDVEVVPPPIPERFREPHMATAVETEPVAEKETIIEAPAPIETSSEQPIETSSENTAETQPQQPAATPSEQPTVATTTTSTVRDYDTPVSVVLEPESRVTIRRLGHTSLTLVVTAIAACLLGFVIGYVVYRYTSFGFSEYVGGAHDDVAVEAVETDVQSDSIVEVAKQDSIANIAPQDSIAKAPAEAAQPTAATDTVRPGNFLTRMARKHYGDSRFWVYIYIENRSKIKDPNNLETGMVLVIPPAEKYGIDAGNPESLKKADQEAYKALNE